MQIREDEKYIYVYFSHVFRKRKQGADWQECRNILNDNWELGEEMIYDSEVESWKFDKTEITRQKLKAIKLAYE